MDKNLSNVRINMEPRMVPLISKYKIDVVGWRSMYLVVMPRVNLIVILSTYARCLYSIN
jgi:hypothetical protein